MSQIVEQTKTKYAKDKKCPNCGLGWIVDHGDILECEDCGCEVDAKCDSCNTPLERDGSDHIACKMCGGYEGFSKRQSARYEVNTIEYAIEKAQKDLEKAKKNLADVTTATRGY